MYNKIVDTLFLYNISVSISVFIAISEISWDIKVKRSLGRVLKGTFPFGRTNKLTYLLNNHSYNSVRNSWTTFMGHIYEHNLNSKCSMFGGEIRSAFIISIVK